MTKRGLFGKITMLQKEPERRYHIRQAVSTSLWREVMPMVTYESLFAYSLVIIGLVGLIVQIYKRK